MTPKELRVNEMIRVREVRLVSDSGSQQIVSLSEALRMAKEAGLDLVEVSPNAVPPVCKILDFGKYRFELEKKSRESKKKQKITKIKEVRMQPKIDKHDLDVKVKQITEFLQEGNKVKVTIRFRGRELAHIDYLGKIVMDKLLEQLQEICIIESPPKMEGKTLFMLLSLKSKKN
jgi:translation initiation factor IF-3